MTPPLAINGLAAISVRLVTPWTGVWIADVDYDLDASGVALSGPATITVGTQTLVGTIDPRASGRFATHARARVAGGGGGWDKTVSARHFHSDAGVLSSTVLSATAAEAGEQIVVASPARLGIDFVRSAGPASRVLAGMPWYVDVTGITQVGQRLPSTPTSDVQVLSWDPMTLSAEIASDTLIVPGTVLTDSRFDGSVTVRDVEQAFSASGGSRTTAWCASNAVTRFAGALANFVQEKSGVAFTRVYRYRVVSQNSADGRLTLQAVAKAPGMPDTLPITPWYGVPGMSAKLTPGAIVLLEFLEGDPSQPAVRGFDSTAVLEIDVSSPVLKIGGSTPLLLAGVPPTGTDWFTQVAAALSTLAPGSITATPPTPSTKAFAG